MTYIMLPYIKLASKVLHFADDTNLLFVNKLLTAVKL